MHVYTLVITAGPRRSAVARADALLDAAVPRGFDYWRTGGWFSDRLAAERPEFDAWFAAQRKRRKRFDAEHPLADDSAIEYDMRDFLWGSAEERGRGRGVRLVTGANLEGG